MLNYFLAEVSTVINSGEAASKTTTNTTSSILGGGTSGSMSWIFIYIIVIFVAMYFMSIRPQKKRQKEHDEMLGKIKPGDSVLCNTGMFGKVVDVTAECYIVEFGMNKGVRVPVLKTEIALVKEPNLSNKEPEPVAEEKTGLFGFKKKAAKKTEAADANAVDAEVKEVKEDK